MIWPESDKFKAFRSEIEAHLPQNLLLRDISSHPNTEYHKLSGRYDQAIYTVWVNHSFLGTEKLYLVSHEVTHAWQYVYGYPHVYPVYATNDIPPDNDNMKDLISRIVVLADRISAVVLDPAADRLLFAREIVQKELLSPTLPKISTEDFKMFDPIVFDRELSRLPNSIKKKAKIDISAYWLNYGLGLITNGCILATGVLCLKEAERFDRAMVQTYYLYPEPIRRVSDTLNEIVVENDIGSASGCRKALDSIIQYLNIPEEVMTIN